MAGSLPALVRRPFRIRFPYLPLSVLALCAAAVPPADAQAPAPVVVTGLVTDASGGVLPGAAVEALRGLRVLAAASTGADGRYRLELPPAGAERVTARLAGFAPAAVDLAGTPARAVTGTPHGRPGAAGRTDPSAAGGAVTADFRLDLAPIEDTVVVTASRTARRRASLAASHSVFTADDVETLGSRSVADVLRHVPGLHVESTGREGAIASVFARGGESDYNHVLIDGVRVNAAGGAYDFGRVAAGEIERVEVVRGAQSTLYGSDAIGSVIQIFTKRGTPDGGPRLSGSVESGSFGTSRGDLRLLGGARRRLDYQLGVAHRSTDGAFRDRLPEPDRFDQQAIDGNAGALVGDHTRLRSGFRHSSARANAVGPIRYAPGDTGTRYDTDALTWHFDLRQRLGSRAEQTFAASWFRAGRRSADDVADPRYLVRAVLEGRPGALYPSGPRLVRLLDQPAFDALAADPGGLGAGRFLAQSGPYSGYDYPFAFETRLRRPAARYQIDARWLDRQVLSAGYDYYRETNALDEAQEVENHSWFVQQQFAIGAAWFVTGGARVDDNAHYGTAVSPRLSAGGFPLPVRSGILSSVKVSANVARGIKNPAFPELYGSQWVDGDLSLRPERALTADAGAEFTFADQRWLARAVWFRNDYTQQIAYAPSLGGGGDGVADYVNVDGSRAAGLELEFGLRRPVGGLTARASYALVDTEVVTSRSTSEQFQPGQPLLRRPRHAGRLRIDYTRGRASLHLRLRVTGDRHDSAFLGLQRVPDGRPVDVTVNPGYALLGLGGQVRVRGGLTLFARIDNATDAAYDSALGYPGLPRAAVAGARFAFGG